MYQYCLLSELERDGRLFEDCMAKLSVYDPQWSRDKILHFIDNFHYNCFIWVNSNRPFKMAGAIAFNPDRQEGIAKVFLVYVIPELRRKGIGSEMTAEFIIFAISNCFAGAQIGLGNSPECIAVLNSVNNRQDDLLGDYASLIEITPRTGVVEFKF